MATVATHRDAVLEDVAAIAAAARQLQPLLSRAEALQARSGAALCLAVSFPFALHSVALRCCACWALCRPLREATVFLLGLPSLCSAFHYTLGRSAALLFPHYPTSPLL